MIEARHDSLAQLGPQLRNLIDRIVLSDFRGDDLIDSLREPAFSFIETSLRSRAVYDRDQRQRLRLKLALHLAPPEAIAYDVQNPKPRWKLIEQHLCDNLSRSTNDVVQLSKEVAATLRSWQEERQSVAGFKAQLLTRDGSRCMSCHIEFDDSSAESIATGDPFKPYFESDPTSPMNCATVDHIEPVSGFGSNTLDNLQLLCKLCNQGKGSFDPPLLKHEAEFAAVPIESIRWGHRAKLLYFALESSDFRCDRCETDDAELTVRKIVPRGAIVSTNLRSSCFGCASQAR